MTNTRIQNKLRQVFENICLTVTVSKLEDKSLSINCESGSTTDITFARLKQLSEYFGTDSIDINNQGKSAGCETCDYGVVYSFTLQIEKATRNYPKTLQ